MTLGWWVKENGTQLVLILMGQPCSWNQCYHCFFSLEASVDEHVVIKTDRQFLREIKRKGNLDAITEIKIYNGGSFLELPIEIFPEIQAIAKGKVLAIESRPEMITKTSIYKIFSKIAPSQLKIFIGFDSFDKGVRNKVLNKDIPQTEITRLTELEYEETSFYSYVLFGIVGIRESTVVESVDNFNDLFKGSLAIEFRHQHDCALEHKTSTPYLLKYLKENCLATDFIGEDDEQWKLLPR